MHHGDGNGDKDGRQAMATTTKRAEMMAMRMAGKDEGDCERAITRKGAMVSNDDNKTMATETRTMTTMTRTTNSRMTTMTLKMTPKTTTKMTKTMVRQRLVVAGAAGEGNKGSGGGG